MCMLQNTKKIQNYVKIIFQLVVDAAEIIQTRASEINEGKSEYYVHYEGCKFAFILFQWYFHSTVKGCNIYFLLSIPLNKIYDATHKLDA